MSPNQPTSLGAAAVRPLRPQVQLSWQPLTNLAILLLAVGVIGFFAALNANLGDRVWQTWLVNLLFFMGIAQAGVVASCAFYLTQARWAGTCHYRLAEAFWIFIPIGLVLFFAMFAGRDHIFPWILHPIPAKAAWLNAPFLFVRDGIALFVMTVLSAWFVGLSRGVEARDWALSPENIEMPPPAIRRLAPIIAILYCFIYSLLAGDVAHGDALEAEAGAGQYFQQWPCAPRPG